MKDILSQSIYFCDFIGRFCVFVKRRKQNSFYCLYNNKDIFQLRYVETQRELPTCDKGALNEKM